jgi:hypothetical protein
MGLFEIILILLILAALGGRGYLALGTLFDFFIALLVIGLIYRLIVIFFY